MKLQAMILGLLLATTSTFAKDARIAIAMPETLKETMLMHMRKHLNSLQKIIDALSKNQFNKASLLAKNELGMQAMKKHNAKELAP